MQHRDTDPRKSIPQEASSESHSSEEASFIQPAEFSFGGETEADSRAGNKPGSRKTKASTQSSKLIPALLGSAMLAALIGVFWVLPQMVEKPVVATIVSTPANTDAPAAARKVQASPYSEAEISQQRREVQKVLQEILQLQEELIERKVEIWAPEPYFAARTLAEQADGIYRQRKFMQALLQYRQALSGLQQVRDSIPERIEQHLADGDKALNIGDGEAAHKAFDLALIISRKHPRGVSGKNRAELLPEVWPHVTAGQEAFSENALDTAKTALEKALHLDKHTAPASALLQEVNAAILERDYSAAMSSGYAAIAAGEFDQAKGFFIAATKLKPKAGDPAVGIKQAENGIAQASINRLFTLARTNEQKEQWHAATEQYSKLTVKDSSLVEALTGKSRSTARAKLDDQLQDLLGDPLTLGQRNRNQYARQVLADARALNQETPRLQGQIKQLETALTQSMIPIRVLLQSDASTNVTIYHVGKLGNFSAREITLKPGRYTAVGTRHGYRDVRQEFVVDPSGKSPTVTIQCAEKIISANNS